jgi:hypothetical protein
MYGGTTATQRANFFASWGLMAALPNLAANAFMVIYNYIRHRRRNEF